MYCCHSIPECYNLFSGVKLSIKSFCFNSELRENGRVSSHQILTGRTDLSETAHEIMNQHTRQGAEYYDVYRY